MAVADWYDFVVVTDRLPVELVVDDRGAPRCRAGHGGLAAALQPVVAERRGAWVGRHDVIDFDAGRLKWQDTCLQPVALSRPDVADHLNGQCDATLVPLYHDGIQPPQFHRRWRQAYRRVNEQYAKNAADIAAPGGVVWVHDHHLQLVPRMLRALRPDLLIGFMLYSPFPPPDLFVKLPLRRDIIDGMLGADLVGFQSTGAARNFRAVASELDGHAVRDDTVFVGSRPVRTGVFPLSIDTAAIQARAQTPAVRERARKVRAELGNPRTVLLAVDRVEPASGIQQRLHAYQELLAERRLDPADTVLIQVAAPGRHDRVDTRGGIERTVAQINGVHSAITRPAVHYLYQTLDADEQTALYLAADVMLATPLCAGMNITAKEYVASRIDDTGALVLSEFTATALDLAQAMTVNPHDTDALKATILDAVVIDGTSEGLQAMRSMREHVCRHDVHRWAGEFLSALGACVATPAHPPCPRDDRSPSTLLVS